MATTSREHPNTNNNCTSWAHQLNALLDRHVSSTASSSTARPTTRGREAMMATAARDAMRKISKKKISKHSRKSATPQSSDSPSSSGRSSPAHERSRKKKIYEQHHECAQCGTCYTSQWRMGPSGSSSLCNACGIRYARELKGCSKHGLMALPNPDNAFQRHQLCEDKVDFSSVQAEPPCVSPRVSSIYALLN